MMYLLTKIGLTHGGSSTVHIYTQTMYRRTQSTQKIHLNRRGECEACSNFAGYIMTFILQRRKKHLNLSQCSRRMAVGKMKTEYTEHSIRNNNNILI